MDETILEVVSRRANALVDPSLHIWGWEIPAYLFLGGLAAGLLALPAARELATKERPSSAALRFAPLAALLLITLGMVALFVDLEHRSHVYRFYLAFRPSSPMSWGALILLLVYPAALLLGLGSLGERWRARLSRLRPLAWLLRIADSRRRAFLWSALGLGAALGLYTGLLLGTLAARPQWSSAVLGPLFLASGLSTGAALLLLFRLEAREREALVRWDLAAIGVELVLLGLLLLGYAGGGRAGAQALASLTGGPWTASFWSVVVIAGLAVPLGLEIAELRRRRPPAVLTSLLVLAGGLALRFILVAAGQASSFRGI